MTTTRPTAPQGEPFPLGAHLVTARRWYTHHGVYVGQGQVIHYAGLSKKFTRGAVTKASLAEFAHGRPVRMQRDANVAYAGLDVVARACSRLGEDAYDLLRNNCEHFCAWCLTGASRSPQVERLLSDSRTMALAVRLLSAVLNAWSAARTGQPLCDGH